MTLATVKNNFVRLSALLFAWWLFGFLSYFPGIDGLKWTTGFLIASICFFCAFALWLSTLKFATKRRLLKFMLLIPSIVIFPMTAYAIDPFLVIIPIVSLTIAMHRIIFTGASNDRSPKTS